MLNKKIVAFFLCMAMLVGTVPTFVFADEADNTDEVVAEETVQPEEGEDEETETEEPEVTETEVVESKAPKATKAPAEAKKEKYHVYCQFADNTGRNTNSVSVATSEYAPGRTVVLRFSKDNDVDFDHKYIDYICAEQGLPKTTDGYLIIYEKDGKVMQAEQFDRQYSLDSTYFLMPEADVYVFCNFEVKPVGVKEGNITGGKIQYSINNQGAWFNVRKGEVSQTAHKGDTIYLRAEDGSRNIVWNITDANGKTVKTERVNDTTWKFTMPFYDVTVDAKFSDKMIYIDRSWNESTKEIEEEVRTVDSFTDVSSLSDRTGVTMSNGTYVLKSDKTFNDHRLTVSGNVKLILCDGHTLNCKYGIRVMPGSTLTIYGQEDDSGKLIAGKNDNCAAIGGNKDESNGNIIICGGTVKADGGKYATGIGSGDEADSVSGQIKIYGGKVTANGGTDAAGIGGGNQVSCGNIYIYGGKVNATGGEYGAGIGAGDDARSKAGTIRIFGGEITAQGGSEGAGIGGGNEIKKDEAKIRIEISGGDITAKGGELGAGIGSGDNGDAGDIIITDGEINAKGGHDGAGIGGGEDGSTDDIRISGGYVNAIGNDEGSGIGGGEDGDSGHIVISGGTVVATAGECGTGIGGGSASDLSHETVFHDIDITGGKVYAKGGAGCGIGSGVACEAAGSINISGDDTYVEASAKGSYAAIGTGYRSESVTINIKGGHVVANSCGGGAAIGSGIEAKPANINISGGFIEADGGNDAYGKIAIIATAFTTAVPKDFEHAQGAGIGGGCASDAGNIKITGGVIFAKGGNDAAGIGGGSTYGKNSGSGGNVVITGGTVYAYAGDMVIGKKVRAEAIGHGGYADTSNKPSANTIKLPGNYSVRYSDKTDDIPLDYEEAKAVCKDYKLSTSAARVSNCAKTQVVISACDHTEKKYTATEKEHAIYCANCLESLGTGSHVMNKDHVCEICGYKGKVCKIGFQANGGSGSMDDVELLKGSEYVLPACGFTSPADKSFDCWMIGKDTYEPGDKITVTEDTAISASWHKPTSLYGYTVSLDGEIAVNFHMELSDRTAQSNTAYMQFELPDGSIDKVLVRDAKTDVIEGKTYYVFTCKVTAKDVAGKIKACMVDDGKKGETYVFSVKEYAEYLLSKLGDSESDMKNRNIILALIDYGAAAKRYFNKEKIEEKSAAKSQTEDDFTAPETENNITGKVSFEGASLSLKSELTMSLYFKSDVKLNFRCLNKEVEYDRAGDYQVARIKGINPADLASKVVLLIDGHGSLAYSPLTFCHNVLTGDYDQNLKNVVRALYHYHKSLVALY